MRRRTGAGSAPDGTAYSDLLAARHGPGLADRCGRDRARKRVAHDTLWKLSERASSCTTEGPLTVTEQSWRTGVQGQAARDKFPGAGWRKQAVPAGVPGVYLGFCVYGACTAPLMRVLD